MKKYIKPKMKVRKVVARSMIAGSIQFSNSSAVDNSGDSDLVKEESGNSFDGLW